MLLRLSADVVVHASTGNDRIHSPISYLDSYPSTYFGNIVMFLPLHCEAIGMHVPGGNALFVICVCPPFVQSETPTFPVPTTQFLTA